MSRSVTIERPGNPITRAEWEDWLNATPGFSATNKIWGMNPRTGKPINIRSESAGAWSRPGGKQDGYFEFYKGRIVPVDPDDDMIAKAKDIAQAFGARVLES